MRFSEDALSHWTLPPSDTEDQKLENAERMVREAIRGNDALRGHTIEVFGKGSYKNNTNIRNNSDVDICVVLKDLFKYDLPKDTTYKDFGITLYTKSYDYLDCYEDVKIALIQKFGKENVVLKNKCIHVKENTYHTDIDVAVYTDYRFYYENGTYREGCVGIAHNTGERVVNYPKQHYDNGVSKNARTMKRYKKVVRIFKTAKMRMEEDNYYKDDGISSFLIESLIWNCPDNCFVNNAQWNQMVKDCICYLWENTEPDSKSAEWGEVSDCLYLFHATRKWTVGKVRDFLLNMWNYMGYAE